jgi:valyl-tRNA synthetase
MTLLFDEDLMLQGRNFATKIWNAFRLIQGWKKEDKPANEADLQTIEWFGNQMNKTIAEINDQFSKFRISDALHLIYKLIWDDFCAWYLEAIKPNYGEGISQEVYDKTIIYFEELMRLLHPFMPFLNGRIVPGNFRKKRRRSFGDCSTEKSRTFQRRKYKSLRNG